jgi:hypothetical protein
MSSAPRASAHFASLLVFTSLLVSSVSDLSGMGDEN